MKKIEILAQKIKKLFSTTTKIWVAVVFALAILVVVIFGLGLGLTLAYQNKTFPNVSIGNLPLGGLSENEARAALNGYSDTIKKNIYTLKFGDRELKISAYGLGEEASLSGGETFYYLDASQAAKQAYNFGRTGSVVTRGFEIWRALLGQADLTVPLSSNFSALEKAVTDASNQFLNQASDARFVLDNGKLKIEPEKNGQVFKLSAALVQLRRQIEWSDGRPINVATEYVEPKINVAELTALQPALEKVIKKLPITMKDNLGRRYSFSVTDFLNFINIAKDENNHIFWQESAEKNPTEALRLQQYFSLPERVTFDIQNNELVFTSKIKRGQGLDVATTFMTLNEALKEDKRIYMVDAATVDLSKDDLDFSPQELGLKEVVATGVSDYSGSSRNRINNIKVGVRSLNGVLIAPGETFSILKVLGAISADKGYLPELVIKQNKTVLELGGGLCQVSTTAFRVALDAGVPIIERYSHAYRVSYYEPAGTDATIYDPSLDFKFKNDYQSYLMLQTEVVGTKVRYYLWGEKDGRTVVNPRPAVFNIVEPPASITTEDPTLPLGEKKCTEKAHKGASASFTQEVVYANGEEKDTVFASKYKPWQEVCLIGTKPVEGGASPTAGAVPASGTSPQAGEPLPIPDLLPAPQGTSPFTKTP